MHDDDRGAVRAFNPRDNDGAKNAELEAIIAAQDAAKAAAVDLISKICYTATCCCPNFTECRLALVGRSVARLTK